MPTFQFQLQYICYSRFDVLYVCFLLEQFNVNWTKNDLLALSTTFIISDEGFKTWSQNEFYFSILQYDLIPKRVEDRIFRSVFISVTTSISRLSIDRPLSPRRHQLTKIHRRFALGRWAILCPYWTTRPIPNSSRSKARSTRLRPKGSLTSLEAYHPADPEPLPDP